MTGPRYASMLEYERRTHGVYRTAQEAKDAAHDLANLLNGLPFGYVFALLPRMGAIALISYRRYA